MPTRMDELVNRLAARLWQLASARVAARVECEVARMQSELLEQAAVYRRGHGKIGEQVARRLELASERLVQEVLDGTGDSGWTGDSEFDVPIDGSENSLRPMAVHDSIRTGKRPRGRPKKGSVDPLLSSESANSDASAHIVEVTDEERTGARDPAGADQVPDLSAEDVER